MYTEKSGYASTNSLLKYGKNIREGISTPPRTSSPQYLLAMANQAKPSTFKAKHRYYMGDFISFAIKLVSIMYVYPFIS